MCMQLHTHLRVYSAVPPGYRVRMQPQPRVCRQPHLKHTPGEREIINVCDYLFEYACIVAYNLLVCLYLSYLQEGMNVFEVDDKLSFLHIIHHTTAANVVKRLLQ